MTFNNQFPIHPDYCEAVRAHNAALSRAQSFQDVLAANDAFTAAIMAIPDERTPHARKAPECPKVRE